MTDPNIFEATLLIDGARLKPFYMRNLIERLFDDYDLTRLTIILNKAEEGAWDSLDLPETCVVEFRSFPCDLSSIRGVTFIHNRQWSKRCCNPYETAYETRDGYAGLNADVPLIEVDSAGRTAAYQHGARKIAPQAEESDFKKFSHLHDNLQGNFIYFPYFPVFRNPSDSGIGALSRYREDAMGFRMARSRSTHAKTEGSHLILLYGGSGAYGLYNSPGRTISGWLEHFLNERLEAAGRPPNVEVLNLAVPSHTVTEAAVIHTLVGERLSPDHVIVHIGWNEGSAALNADSALLKNDIVHLPSAWSFVEQMFNDTGSGRRVNNLRNVTRNGFEDGMSAILRRAELMQRSVVRAGSRFTLGIQPSLFHRLRPHPDEAELVGQTVASGADNVRRYLKNLAGLRWLADHASASPANLDVIDFKPVVEEAETDCPIFWDPDHPNAIGCRIIAEDYARRILPTLLSPES